jgi:hypothetical protein
VNAGRGRWLALAAGAAAFLAFTRGAVLDPRRTDWLLQNLDSASAYLGWRFFREAPLAQFPFGANPRYGLEVASSVVYTDSIPLLAFAFKPLAPLLPAGFQYFGLWLLACFLLQALFAWRLLERFTQDRALLLLGTGFFLLAPALLFRLGGHFALFGQWVLLAALALYFAARFAPWRWAALLAVTALIHFYLLAMVGVLWAADLVRRRWQGGASTPQALVHAAAALGGTLLVMLCAGYFTVGHSAGGLPGFGIYRMNLLAPVDPNQVWSALLPDQPGGPGDYEGFNYFGLGVLLLLPLAAGLFARKPVALDGWLVAAALVLTALALSNKVAFGASELFAYELPELIRPLAELPRASGRLFWPVYYLLVLAALALVWRLPRRAALGVTAAALAIQLADLSRALGFYAGRFTRPAAWASPLQSPRWAELGTRYERVRYVLPRNSLDTFLPWAMYAAEHRMAINFGYFARVDAERMVAARDALEAAVRAGRFDAGSLYVFENDGLWNLVRGSPYALELDGFRLIAPPDSAARSAGSAPAGARAR